MKEKPKNEHKASSFLYIAVPLWLVLFIFVTIIGVGLLNMPSEPPPTFITITATPDYYGKSNADTTFIEELGSPTPDIETTAEVDVATTTPMCADIARTQKGQFVFRMFLQSGMDLFRIDEDDENFCRLTNNTGNDDYPAWSPDGLSIAYVSNDGDYGLYLMDADGQNVELLNTGGSAYSYPAWSSDGQYIVFQATFDEVFDIYRLELATGDVINLTNQERLDNMPSYSPDGQFIVFTSDRIFNPFVETNLLSQYRSYEIYMMDSDGYNPRRLTVNNRGDSHPTFSPDGLQIAYSGIKIMNRDGSGLYELVSGSQPIWLSDGRIVYLNYMGEIHSILPDGTEDTVLVNQIPIFGSGIQQLDYTPAR